MTEGSSTVVVAGEAAVVVGSALTVATGFSWTFLATFLVRFVAVLFALTVFFAVVFDFLEALACLPFFFAALRTISVVISFSSSYSVRKIALHRSKIRVIFYQCSIRAMTGGDVFSWSGCTFPANLIILYLIVALLLP